MNRTEAPAFRQVENIELIRAKSLKLTNGVSIYVINGGEQELVRIEFIFRNVNWDPSKALLSYAANSMLTDGTSEFTAAEIAERVDYFGAFLQVDYNFDFASVVVHSLNKHLGAILPIVKAILTDAVFPQVELDTFVRNQKQKLSVSLEKNDVLGRRAFTTALFGETIYGHPATAADFDALRRDDLLACYRKTYQPGNCTIIISGKVSDEVTALLAANFDAGWNATEPASLNSFSFTKGPGLEHYIERPDALQSAIRLGQISINRTHDDFPGLQVLNTVLGGYFGSRLMSNIREDKGYTYGIGSALASLKDAGYFVIASEVGADVCTAAIEEIKKEIGILRTVPVPQEELALVKNYMMGSLLGGLENAFSHADKFKNIFFSDLDYSYYDRYVDTVKTISSERLLQLANTYLDFDGFEKVIVGKR